MQNLWRRKLYKQFKIVIQYEIKKQAITYNRLIADIGVMACLLFVYEL